MCRPHKLITAEEYQKRFDEIKNDILEKHIKNIADDEVLVATLQFRDDEDLTGYGIFSEPFRTYEKLMDFVTTVADDDDNEQERMWVEVVKYKIHNGEHKDILHCNFSLTGEMLGVRYYMIFADDEKYRELRDIQDFLSYPRNVVLPFERGDIIRVDATPYGKPFYAVYCGESEAGEIDKYGYYHYCLYISEDRNGLDVGRIINHFADILFINPPFSKLQKVDTCDDLLLTKASRMLKEKPALWYKWNEIYDGLKHNEGLEKWIFTDL